MNKKELAKNVARKLSITDTLSYEYINVMQDVILEELKQNGYIMFQGFGVFSPWIQTERMGRNPKTGINCLIESRVSVKFKPGKNLLKQLNMSKKREK